MSCQGLSGFQILFNEWIKTGSVVCRILKSKISHPDLTLLFNCWDRLQQTTRILSAEGIKELTVTIQEALKKIIKGGRSFHHNPTATEVIQGHQNVLGVPSNIHNLKDRKHYKMLGDFVFHSTHSFF